MKKRIALIVMLISIGSCQLASAADSGVVTATSGLRVREKSSISSTIAGHLLKDSRIVILGKEGEFYKISYKGKTGYIHSSYVDVKGVSASTGGNNVQASSKQSYGETTADYLNVRSGAGLSYAVNGVIKHGSKVTMYGKTNGFYKINYDGKTSYISELYVKAVGKNAVETISTSRGDTTDAKLMFVGTVTASSLSVRRSSSISNNIMGAVYSPNKVSVYGSEGEFYKIKYANQWAYVYKSYVSNGIDTQSKPKEVESKQENNDGISGDKVVAYASKFMGVPYVWGGATPAGFDCSGLVQYVYKNFGINMPRTTMDQVNVGTSVSINNLQKGDLIYFRMNASDPNQVSHVGIYIGNNKFMHSPKPGDVAKTSEINSYYTDHFAKARRMIK